MTSAVLWNGGAGNAFPSLVSAQGFTLPWLPAHHYQGWCSAPFQHMRHEEYVYFVPYEGGFGCSSDKTADNMVGRKQVS